ncbi:MAG: S26 family signal peptidase [Burkholderiales bacterium]|nr:S26 family signal peptidase [Burkholderiales bacterium]
MHIYFNPSASLPTGYYAAYMTNNFEINEFVIFCINDALHAHIMHQLGLPQVKDQCQFNTPYLIKKIVARYKDKITISSRGIYINNNLIPNSVSLQSFHNISLVPLPYTTINLQKDQYFVLGQTKTSYDSRYFGVINKSQIISKAVLLIRIK